MIRKKMNRYVKEKNGIDRRSFLKKSFAAAIGMKENDFVYIPLNFYQK